MRIGVTGAGGFVGRAVVRRLQRGGHRVVPLVRIATGATGEVVVGDLAAPVIPASPPPLDALIHLAACTHFRGDDAQAVAKFQAVNVEGTRAMLELARRSGVRRFVFISSVKVNGERTVGRAYTELDPPQPEDAYGRSKLAAEEVVHRSCRAAGIDFVILRPPLIYGVGQKGNLRALVRAERSGVPLPFGRVRNRRSLIHVDNLADLIAVVTDHPLARDRVFMAEDGTTVSTADLIRAMAAATGRRARLLPIPTSLLSAAGRLVGRGGQIERLLGDLEVDGTTTRTLLGWVPPIRPAAALATIGAAAIG